MPKKIKECKEDYVVLQCDHCKTTKSLWKLDDFMRVIGEEYQRKGFVFQPCNSWDYPHVIVGMRTEHTKFKTPGQVFGLWNRKKNKKTKNRS